MSNNVKLILIGVVALIVGAAGGVGYGMMQVDDVTQKLVAALKEKDQAVQNADRLRKINDDAVKKYGADLGKLVLAAGALGPDDPAKLIDSVRAMLAARDGFRASLDGARAAMNSEFDALAAELGNAMPNADKVKQLLDTLKQGWPDKEKNLEDATRKLLVDLGLLQAPPAPKPIAAPAPMAAPAPEPAAPAPAPAKK
jgi:uncharacterized protein HemX